jgi:hypothetical protein
MKTRLASRFLIIPLHPRDSSPPPGVLE